MSCRTISAAATVAVFSVLAAPSLGATTLFDSQGFETPNYTTGSLVGQYPADANFTDEWVISAGTPGANVQTSVVKTGSQAVQVDRTTTTDQRYFWNQTPQTAARYVFIDWDMRYALATAVSANNTGPFFGIESYSATAAGPGVYTPHQQGALGVDTFTGKVLFLDPSFGAMNVGAGPALTPNTWNHFQIVVDYLTQTYNGYVNGTPAASNVAWNDATPATLWGDADLSHAATDFGTQLGAGYFDNLLVTTAPELPEPVSAAALAAGALIGLKRQRR
ncbi:MAG: hypothetical protein QM770_15970 [Tepidisphaeraceae bacterium]